MEEYSFFQNVCEIVRQIPEGRVSSYGAIAKYLGMKSGARSVGWALNQSISNKDPLPAHRVVNRNGMLTGKIHFPGDTMERLLKMEGINIENDAIVNFEMHFWDPEKELGT